MCPWILFHKVSNPHDSIPTRAMLTTRKYCGTVGGRIQSFHNHGNGLFEHFCPASISRSLCEYIRLSQCSGANPVDQKAIACVLSIFAGWISDRYKQRAMIMIVMAPVAITGFFLLEFLPNSMPSAKYGALYVACAGYYPFYPIWLTWVSNSLSYRARLS